LSRQLANKRLSSEWKPTALIVYLNFNCLDVTLVINAPVKTSPHMADDCLDGCVIKVEVHAFDGAVVVFIDAKLIELRQLLVIIGVAMAGSVE